MEILPFPLSCIDFDRFEKEGKAYVEQQEMVFPVEFSGKDTTGCWDPEDDETRQLFSVYSERKVTGWRKRVSIFFGIG